MRSHGKDYDGDPIAIGDTHARRTKLGIIVAFSVIAGIASVWLAVLLLVLAALLIAWGQAPKRTQEFVGRLPGGNYHLEALDKLDSILPG